MDGLRAANLALRFALELAALVALAYWGFQAGDSTLVHVLLGLGAPLAAALVWGVFIAPKARRPVSLPVRFALDLVVFGSAVAALVVAGQTVPAAVFAAAVVISEALLYGLH